MIKTYENVGMFPLEFIDRQQVETGEQFSRDFAASVEGDEQERWLISVGHVRIVGPATQPPARQPTPEPVQSDRSEE